MEQLVFLLIDASMKCLIENGWVNFRMRASMLYKFNIKFFCHYLGMVIQSLFGKEEYIIYLKLFLITIF